MAEQDEKSASGGPKGSNVVYVAPGGPPPDPATVKAANEEMRKRLESGRQEQLERNRAASINSKATTDAHRGKRVDEPHKPREMEAIKVGKAVPAGKKGGIDIDPAGKGAPTDTVFPGGYGPASPIHADDLETATPVHPPDAAGTFAAVKDEVGDKKSLKVEGDPGAEAGKEAHAGENANIPANAPAEVTGKAIGEGDGKK